MVTKKGKSGSRARYAVYSVLGTLSALLILAAIVVTVRFHLLDGLFSSCSPVSAREPELPAAGSLCVYTADVGQGSAAFLVSPNGKTMLIDSGDAEHAQSVAELIRYLGFDTIDVAVGTHPHSDHIGAMPALLNEFSVGEYVEPAVPFDCAARLQLSRVLEARNIPVRNVLCGDKLDWDENCTVTVLSPILGCAYSDSDANDYSLIIRVEYGDNAFIFTGDATVHDEQLAMFHNERDLFRADVLTVAHHGSTTGSSYGFLETVGAGYAIISVGADNDYGHPSPEILSRLANVGSEVFRTDLCGWISIFSDGRELTVDYMNRQDTAPKE